MNAIEFFPYHNKHILFERLSSGEKLSGVIYDMPWDRKNGIDSNYFFIKSKDLHKLRELDFDNEKALQEGVLQIIDINDVGNIDFFSYNILNKDIDKLHPSIHNNIDFFKSFFAANKRGNESFVDFLSRFEKESLEKFKDLKNTVVDSLVAECNRIYGNNNSPAVHKLGFSFTLKVFTNIDFTALEADTSQFIQIRFKKDDWTQEFINNNLPYLFFDCDARLGEVTVFAKPNLSGEGEIKIGDFVLYKEINTSIIASFIVNFLDKTTSRMLDYA